MTRPLLCLSIVALTLGLSSIRAKADSTALIGFELYSWKDGAEWRYAVLEGTTTPRSAERIHARQNRLKDMTYLKGRLAALPANDILYWREDKRRNFNLPPKEITHQVQEYTEALQLHLHLPGEVK
jgi:hypothetical protein